MIRLRGSMTALFALLIIGCQTSDCRGGLVFENLAGVSMVYDSVTNTTWTQNGYLAGQNFNQQDAESWATNLTFASLPGYTFELASSSQFTSLFTQLDPYGAPGTQSNKYGSKVTFGPGTNDFVSNVQTTYWTSDSTGVDFNFYYGYAGSADPSTTYATWAVVASVPEPRSIGLVLVGFSSLGIAHLRRARVLGR